MRNISLLRTIQLRHWLVMLLLIMSSANCGRAYAGVEFLSISDNAAIMYDAPSLKAEKLYVASRYLPVEAIVNVEGWVKVRDSSGSLVWMERKALSNQRFVIVTVPQAKVYQAPNESSELIFQVQEQVVMEWLDSDVSGWVKVRHRDGQIGYVRANQVWGS